MVVRVTALGISPELSAAADQVTNEARVAAGVDHGGDDRPVDFHKIIDRQMTIGNEGAAVVVEFDGKDFGVQRDPIREDEIAFEKTVAVRGSVSGEIVVGGLHVGTDGIERDHGQAFHDWRRMDRFSSAMVTVVISPRT